MLQSYWLRARRLPLIPARSQIHRLLAAVLTAVALPCAAYAQTGTATWTGAAGNWTATALWTTTPNAGFVPTDGNDGRNWNATVAGFAGTLTLDQAIIIEQLTLSGGGITITGSNDLTMNGLMTWNGGTLSGTGGTFANGGVTFSGSSQPVTLNGRSLTMSGASTWSSGNIIVGNGSVLINTTGSTLTATSINTSLTNSPSVGGAGSFINNGTFVNQTGTGTTTFGSNSGTSTFNFANTGTVDVQSGTLSLPSGGTNSGTLNVAAGATVQFGGGTFDLSTGSVLAGAGSFIVANETAGNATLLVSAPVGATNLTVFDGILTANAPLTVGALAVSGNSTLNGSADVTVNGPVQLGGCTISGSGSVTVNGGVEIGAGTINFISGRSLTIRGTSSWSGGIGLYNGGVITNTIGSTLSTSNCTLYNAGGTAAFINNGTFVNQSGTASISVTFTNNGTVDVQSGTLAAATGIANSGVVQVAPGATVSGSITSAGSGAFVRGAGTYAGPLLTRR